jgi:hypothetical protein
MLDRIDQIQITGYQVGGCASRRRLQDGCAGQRSPHSVDRVTISEAGKAVLNATEVKEKNIAAEIDLTPEEKQQVENLKKIDQEVKTHERAHMAAGSGLIMGGASFEYQRGPDGKMYAVGGEVKIDTSRENDPEETIRKMQRVRRAALAPAQPSATDRSVAAQASQIEAQARTELTQQKSAQTVENKDLPVDSFANNLPNAPGSSQPSSALGNSIDIVV